MFSVSDWALKRVLKFVLKKSVGRFLHSEPDLEQLDVQLSTGTFELRNVLLNCDAVNEQLAVDGWLITAGYIGLVRGALPLNGSPGSSTAVAAAAAGTLAANLTLDEVLITIAPAPDAAAAPAAAPVPSAPNPNGADAAAAAAAASDGNSGGGGGVSSDADDLGLLGQMGVLEGIKLIAGGLEALLQRLSVAVTNVTVRVEVPTPAAAPAGAAPPSATQQQPGAGAELIVHIDCLHYSDATPPQQQEAAAAMARAGPGQQQQLTPAVIELVKRVSVTGLTLELLELTDDGVAAASALSNAMCASQLLCDSSKGATAAAAAGAALRDSFAARGSMLLRGSCILDPASASGGSGEDSGAQQEASAAAAGLGGLLLGGPELCGLDVGLELRLAWSTNAAAAAAGTGPGASSSQPPRITADINSSAVSLHLQPWQLPLLVLCSSAASSSSKPDDGAARAAASSAGAGLHSNNGRQQSQEQQQQGWGQRSFVEDLFFPHVEGFLVDSLSIPRGSAAAAAAGRGTTSSSAGAGSLYNSVTIPDGSAASYAGLLGGSGANSSSTAVMAQQLASSMYSVYQDARSVFSSATASALSGGAPGPTGSLGSVFSSMYNSVLNPSFSAGSSQQQGSGAAADGSGQQKPLPLPATWSVRASCPAASASLYYHVPACGAAAAGTAAGAAAAAAASDAGEGTVSQHPPRFVLQCGGLVASYDAAARARHASVKLYQLQAFEQLPPAWGVVAGSSSSSADQQLLSPAVLGSVPRVLPVLQGSTPGLAHQVPAWSAPAARTDGSSSSLLTWPVLAVAGVALEPSRALPTVQRASLVVKASAHSSSGSSHQKWDRLAKAAVECEMLPSTLWLNAGLQQRLASIGALLLQQQRHPAATAGVRLVSFAAAGAAGTSDCQQQQRQVLPPALQGADVTAAVHMSRLCVVLPLPPLLAAAPAADGPHSCTSSSHCMFLVLDLHSGSNSSSSSSGYATHHQQHHQHSRHVPREQQPGVLRAAAAAAAAGSRVLPLLQLSSSPMMAFESAPAGADVARQPQQQGAVVEASLTRLRLFHVTQSAAGSDSSSANTGLAAAAAAAAAASPNAGQQRQGYSLSRLLRRQQQQPSNGSADGNAGSGKLRLAASCILDAGPAAAPPAATASNPLAGSTGSAGGSGSGHSSMASSGALVAAAGLGFGPDDVPWGSALFATVTLNPAAQADAAVIADAAAMAAAHAKDTGADGEEGCHDVLTTGGDDAWPFAGTAAAAADTSSSNAAGGGAAAAGTGRGGMYGCSSQIGVLKFQHRCQAGSGVVVHVRAPAVSGFASREELAEIVQAAVAAATAAATAEAPATASSSSGGDSDWQQQQQVALLLQCRLHCCFQGLPQHAGSSHHSGHGRHSYHAQHTHSSSNSSHARPLQQQAGSGGGSQPFAAASAFEVLVDDITLFRVSNLGGRRAASAACVCMQGLQVYTGGGSSSGGSSSNRLCALLLPKHSKTLGPPGVEVLQVNPGDPDPASNSASSTQGSSRATSSSRRSKAAAAAAAAPGPMPGVLSVLLRGATLSLDAGGLSLDWAAQLADFVAPLAASAAAGAAAAAAPVASPPVAAPAVAVPLQQQKQQQQQALVVNLQDFALRFEPRCDVPGSHNSSRMAAALVLDGAHWQLNPGPAAPQQVLLHSLGFYVAAAAARSGSCSSSSAVAMGAGSGSKGSKASSSGRGGLGAWDAAAPVDLHGTSLSSAGYNCLAQEGGLAVLLRPAAAGAPAAGVAAPAGTLEVEVTNTHLTGSLRKDTAALAIQLINQWAAHALLRNPPRYAAGLPPSPRGAAASRTNASASSGPRGSNGPQPQQRQVAASEMAAALQDNALFMRPTPPTPAATAAAGAEPGCAAAPSSTAAPAAAAAAPRAVALDLNPWAHAAAAAAHDASSATQARGGAAASLQSSMFLSGGWYNAAGDSATRQQQQQPSLATVAASGSRNSSAASSQVQRGSFLADWGLEQEPGASSSMADGAATPTLTSAGAAAAGSGAGGERQGSGSSSLASSSIGGDDEGGSRLLQPFDEALLAASILATLPDGGAAASGARTPAAAAAPAVPVVLDDFFLTPAEAAELAAGGDTDADDNELLFGSDDGRADDDDDYAIISPRAAAAAASEAAAAAAKAARSQRRAAAAAAAAAAPCPEQGVWYGSSTAGAAAAGGSPASEQQAGAGGGSSGTSGSPPTGEQQGPAKAAQGVRHLLPQSPAPPPAPPAPAAAASQPPRQQQQQSLVLPPPLQLQEDYLTPVSPEPDGGLVGHAHGGLLLPGLEGASTPRGFVSPWARVLSHPIFQHLLPQDPAAPRPVSRLVCRGLSGMFVLHDKGAVLAAGSSGRARSNGRAPGGGGGASSASGGRLELEVDGVSLSCELYPPGHCQVSRFAVAVGSIEIRDCLGTAATAAAAAGGAAGGGRGGRPGSGLTAAAAAAAAAASAAASAAAAGQGPRQVAAAAAAAGAASSRSAKAKAAGGSSSGATSGRGQSGVGGSRGSCSRVLSVRRPGTQGGASINQSIAASRSSTANCSPASKRPLTSLVVGNAVASGGDSLGLGSSRSSSLAVSPLPSPLHLPAAAAGDALQQPQQQPPYEQQQHSLPPSMLLGGMLQGWPAAVLAPDSLLPAVAVVLETVRPDPAGPPESDEYRLGIALLPIRLRLNQDLVAFLRSFVGAVGEAVAAVENPLLAAAAAAAAAEAETCGSSGAAGAAAAVGGSSSSAAASTPSAAAAAVRVPPPPPGSGGVQPPFFQKVSIWGTGVCVDYRPRRVDVAALREGEFLELLNLVPWGGVDLALKPLAFTGLLGWEGLAAGVAAEWLGYVARTQAHKFLAGVAPIRSVIKVSAAVAGLLAGPAASLQDALGGAVTAAAAAGRAGAAAMQQHQHQQTGGGSSGAARARLQAALQAAAAAAMAAAGSGGGGSSNGGAASRASFQDVMRGINAGFARSLLYEAMGVGASVAAGAQSAFAAPQQGFGVGGDAAGAVLVQGLKAAAGEVQGGFQAAAAALARGAGAELRAGDIMGAAKGVLRVAPAAAAAPARGLAAGVRAVLLSAQQAAATAAAASGSAPPELGLQQQRQAVDVVAEGEEDKEEEEEEEEEEHVSDDA